MRLYADHETFLSCTCRETQDVPIISLNALSQEVWKEHNQRHFYVWAFAQTVYNCVEVVWQQRKHQKERSELKGSKKWDN